MNKEKAQAALLTVALQKGIPLEAVIQEIDTAIAAAYQTAQKNPASLDKWKRIPCKGEIPTALEMVSYLGDIVVGIQAEPNHNESPDCAKKIKDFYC